MVRHRAYEVTSHLSSLHRKSTPSGPRVLLPSLHPRYSLDSNVHFSPSKLHISYPRHSIITWTLPVWAKANAGVPFVNTLHSLVHIIETCLFAKSRHYSCSVSCHDTHLQVDSYVITCMTCGRAIEYVKTTSERQFITWVSPLMRIGLHMKRLKNTYGPSL